MNELEIVEVQFCRDGLPGGRKYHYFTAIPLQVGDRVAAPVGKDGEGREAEVCATQVPSSQVDERFLPVLKTITALAAQKEDENGEEAD